MPRLPQRPALWVVFGLLAGCANTNHQAILVDRPSNGRAQGCPENPVAWGGRAENMTPDSVRCSYADANGETMTRLTGRVMAEAKPGHPGYPAGDLMVTVHEIPNGPALASRAGKMIAKAQTDAQGRFAVSVSMPGERYLLVVREGVDGPAIAARPLEVGFSANVERRAINDVLVVLPLDDALRAERTDDLPNPARKPDPPPIETTAESEPEPAAKADEQALPPAKPLNLGASRASDESAETPDVE